MKSLTKSFDVFEFKDEDELTGMAVKKYSPKSRYRTAVDGKVSGTKFHSKENDTGIFGGKDAADVHYNHDAAGSFTPSETEDFAEDTPELSHVLLNVLKTSKQAKEMKSNVIESGNVFASVECGPSPCATVRLEEYSNCVFPGSSCNDKSADLASDVDESMSERSPSATANNKASSDGPSSDICFSGWNFGDERMEIVFCADYVNYCGIHYLDSVVSFSRSSVEARSKTTYGNEESFQIHLEIEDIVRIESQWSARFEAGTIHIYFISKDAVQEDDLVHNASGLQKLSIPANDSNWYKKQEAIESLDVRYKALWSVRHETGMDNSSDLPDGEALMLKRSYFPKFDKPFEEVIYPKGDPDAVSISKRDVDLLLPDTFVNDTIIDFYIKYLKTRQHVKERTELHFFNSFFFRKLADMDKDPSSAFDGKAAFQRVRKWTRKVNLLEKDFIFIPVNYNYHWSLIVICYFGEIATYKEVENGQSVRVPCILHMDSLRGNHVGLKDLLQSYLWEEWKERQKGTCEDLYSKFRNLKFVPLELPQQQNSYDCGLFLLHYVELFLEEVPTNFSIYKITSSTKFLQADWFPPGEASMKRSQIERLINGLLDTQSEDCPQSDGSGMHCSAEDPNTTHDHESGVELSVKSGPLSCCIKRSPCQVGQGIELTLLPASSVKSTQCTKTSILILKELFKQPSASGSFSDTPWEAHESRATLDGFTRHVHMTEEEEVEANECFVQTELAEPVFQNLDCITEEAPIFPYSSEDFRLDLLHQPATQDANSSPVTSGCESGDILEIPTEEKWQSVEETVSLEGEPHKHTCISSENVENLTDTLAFSSGQLVSPEEPRNLNDKIGDSFFLKNLSEFRREENELHDRVASFASGDKLEVDIEDQDEQRITKRMRMTSPGGGEGCISNLSKDLHL